MLTSAALLESLPQAALVLDRRLNVLGWNQRFGTVLALSAHEIEAFERSGSLAAWTPECPALAGTTAGLAARLQDAFSAASDQCFRLECWHGRRLELTVRPVSAAAGFEESCWLVLIEDVTASALDHARITRLLGQDELTTLANRRRFTEELALWLARGARRGGLAAVLHLGLDRFKAVNVSLGHAFGDRLLQAVAKRLAALIRAEDLAARLGGDEFGVLLPQLDGPRSATDIAARLIDVIGRPYLLEGHTINIGVSIGIAFSGSDGGDADDLLKAADLALRRAKQDGQNLFRCFEPGMDLRMQRRRELENALRAALPRREFELHFQPLFDLDRCRIDGFEALLRWNSPSGGTIPPGDFVPLAEELGLIVPIGRWVLKTACKTTASWPDDIAVAVNLSPVQFKSPCLVSDVAAALAASGLSPHRLQLEITESVLMSDSEANLTILHHFRALGIKLAMDDFGTGYASLGYLRSFPFDKIKIDQSFVRDMPRGRESAAIVGAISALAHRLGMRTTAEGVETRAQLRQITSDGCCEAQGYLIGRPIPADQIDALLARTDMPAEEDCR